MNTRFLVGFWTTLSIITSTIQILLLKLVARRTRCKYTTTLSTYHYLATWFVLEFAAFTNNISRTTAVPLVKRIILAALVVASISLLNLSLDINSMSLYQFSKLFCIPYLMLHNKIFKRAKYTPNEYVSIALILAGVSLFSFSDIEFNIKGIIVAILCVLSTSYAQTLIHDYQAEYKLNGSELQLSIIPYQFIIGCIASTLFESTGEGGFMTSEFQVIDLLLLIITCFFAIWVNIAAFHLIGETSPTTFQVVGQVKSVLILILSAVFFPVGLESLVSKIIAGIGVVMTLLGAFIYMKPRFERLPTGTKAEAQPFLSQKL